MPTIYPAIIDGLPSVVWRGPGGHPTAAEAVWCLSHQAYEARPGCGPCTRPALHGEAMLAHRPRPYMHRDVRPGDQVVYSHWDGHAWGLMVETASVVTEIEAVIMRSGAVVPLRNVRRIRRGDLEIFRDGA